MTRSAYRLQLGLTVIALLALAVALRLPFSTGFPDDPDGVRFIRSLEHYDVLSFAPHFPGYPVAVGFARAAATLLPTHARPGEAWAVLGCVAGALTGLFAGLWATRLHRDALIPVLVSVTVLPFLVGESWRVGSDTVLLPFLFSSLWLLSGTRRESFAGALLLGFALGVRPSAFPFTLAILGSRYKAEGLVAWSTGVLLWLFPVLSVVGADAYFSEGYRFVVGHFSGWGGASFGSDSTRWVQLLRHWIWAPISFPFLPAAFGLLSLAYILGGVWQLRGLGLKRGPAFYGACGYTLWIAVAQNASHARHALPLIVLALALSTTGWVFAVEAADFRGRVRLLTPIAICVVVCLTSSLLLGVRYATSRPPVLQVVDALARHEEFDPLLDRLYVGEERPFFCWGECELEGWNVATVPDVDSLSRDLQSLPIAPRRVWVASSVRGLNSTPFFEYQRHPDISEWGSRVAIHLWKTHAESTGNGEPGNAPAGTRRIR